MRLPWHFAPRSWRRAATGTTVLTPPSRILQPLCASALIRKGLSLKVVQARLGHASAVKTLDVNGHLWPDDEDRTRQAVDELLGGELAED
jgi:integrase